MPFKTLLAFSQSEIIVEKSKFIAHVQPVKTEEEAQAFIESIKKKHYNATHNVPVYRIGSEGQLQKYSDDGEPAGTAGFPVLDFLKKESISNVCIVITRYYGGIKLGTGGLVRAYTAAAKNAFFESKLYDMCEFTIGTLEIDYNWYPLVNHLFETMKVCILDTAYSETVLMTLALEKDNWTKLCDSIYEKTNGTYTCESTQEVFASREGLRIVLS